MDQLEPQAADVERHAAVERPGGQDERVDRRRPLDACRPRSRRGRAASALGGARRGDHLAVGERRGAGDVVEMPVAEHDHEARDALGLERVADEAGVLDRDVRVVDQRLVAVDDRVAGDAERQRAVVDPVRALGEAVALDAPVVEGDDPVGRVKHAHVVHGARIISIAARRRPSRAGWSAPPVGITAAMAAERCCSVERHPERAHHRPRWG